MDLIDRQEAIKAMSTWDWQELYLPVHFKQLLEELPAAQPDSKESSSTHKALDTISRAEAIEHLKKRLYETEFNSTAEYPYYQEIADNRVDVWMNEVPSAQPERKTGQWVDGQCSNCGCDIPAYIIDWKWQKDMDANYCPNCGAYMRGEQDGSD